MSRFSYTGRVCKLLQNCDQVSALPYQSSLERSSHLGKAQSQYQGFKPKSWAVCAQLCILGVVNNYVAGHSRPTHYSWKTTMTAENIDAAGQTCALAAMWKPFLELFTASMCSEQHSLTTPVKPLCLLSTRNQSWIFFPKKASKFSICKIKLQ